MTGISSSDTAFSPTAPEDIALRIARAFDDGVERGARAADEVVLLLVEAGTGTYALPVAVVREIVPFTGATRLPGAPEFVSGLLNRRGTIVTILDLARCVPAGGPLVGGRRERRSVVLVDHGARSVGLLVDGVLDVRAESADCVRAATASMGPGEAGVRLDASSGESVFLLNLDQILTTALQREGTQ